MPNIQQQKKRVGIAARQRFENLRYRSTVKTLGRRLESAVQDGDASTIEQERRRLEHWLDLAAARGAIHKNKAARRKSQVARLVSAVTPAQPEAAPAAAEPKPEPKPRRGRRKSS
jgi:small subunit ribosomal protein S20